MSSQLRISAGQYSSAGRKPVNQDFHGLCIPREPLLSAKGIAVALADGISSSEAGQIASEAAVKSFLADYYCTTEAWSVKRSAQRVLAATNAWLHAHTQRGQGRFDKERGHVCTFSALVLRSTTAHLFHVGDTRIHRLHGQALEQLTTDHRVVVAPDESYLSRALGIWQQIDLDYQALPLEVGDTFVLTSDGVHEQMDGAFVAATVARLHDDLDLAARTIVEEALRRGSGDNLTVQIVRVDALPDPEAAELPQLAAGLRPPPLPEPGALLDGYRIVRELHASHRSHLYLVQDEESGERLVMKVPSIDMREDAAYLERFLLEEWVARRIHSPHVLRAAAQRRQRSALYVTLEYLEGQTLAQWMADHPTPDLETVRGMVEQIARGLQAFHRMEMVHQDLRPENVMIDREGTLKIIDFGATRVASVMELLPEQRQHEMLGTLQYSAPEYLLAEGASNRADLFSLGVIAYQMLSGRLPYGIQVARLRRHAELRKLRYVPLYELDRRIPLWVDGALRKAVHPDPRQRYEEVSEFVWDLRHPNPAFLGRHRPPLIERNPLAFWKGVSLLLLVLLLVLLATHPALR
ncbi:MAG TPA: bifunctional protein-serine/threonine kinase/phosphatase [Pseudomonadales bacterium]|jgi:serine/threonine protein phosphatase PrpC|nr:bifunctional protein-serine/threonine kinase/phosphatase [Pseudomonadales bacterium]HMW14627.1 bifunctional protein-serine/threonine kinase/phosphatase [Pseudomonadales bacterium]HMW82413.1 bifunctional protein-serine/threonine kinase/phosphatase [Pseudomonadales bacterium]HMY95909.1 bifunctional protein-serine/threonine kinase/phosphatase [Pseudomonadales bacterium]HMZ70188.1 bifunctional protein-serine/threonine kinase/phosphatase [Pseudomonadales bacterium]